MASADDVCVIIPTLNEVTTIGEVIDGYTERGYNRIVVVDGHSTDGTVEQARAHGASVLLQDGSGKGRAVREGIQAVVTPYILLVDGDGTYLPSEADRILDPVLEGRSDHVIGNRFANLQTGAMSRLNRLGNLLINWVFAKIHRRDLQDILSGYRAFTRESVDEMQLSADGFGIETEMAVECVRNGIPTEVVDITYRSRPGESSTNLRPFRDGSVIVSTLWRLAKTTNPMFYFGTMGTLSIISAVMVGAFVGYEWFVRGIPHQVLAMVSVFGILFGFQLLTFGILTDLIVKFYR